MTQKPDEPIAKPGGTFTPHPEGQFAAACVDVVDLGMKVDDYQGKKSLNPKVALIFATGERREVDKGKSDLALVTVEMTNTSGKKGNLRKFLESWRGKSYSDEQVSEGLPLGKLHGQNALITIEHKVTGSGNKMAKVRAIAQLPEVMKSAVLWAAVEEYTRPKFLEDRKVKYAEEAAQFAATPGASDPGPTPQDDDDDPDSSLPF